MIENKLWLWSKISTVHWEDAWEERLRFLPAGCVSFVTTPGSRALRMRAYCDGRTAGKLLKAFGGVARELREEQWNAELGRELRPLNVRGRLVVHSTEETLRDGLAKWPGRDAIWIPASMAFGTGSHPTTAGCLRLLCDEAAALGDGWSMADLGTGSGILAIAGVHFGAGRVFALDYDPVCVREARLNARRNRVRLAAVERADVLHWRPAEQFQIVAANLFSDTLIAGASALARAVIPGGALIFSGVLRPQLDDVQQALADAGLEPEWHNARGKWVFGRVRRR